MVLIKTHVVSKLRIVLRVENLLNITYNNLTEVTDNDYKTVSYEPKEMEQV